MYLHSILLCSWFGASSPKGLLNELFPLRGELLREGEDKLDDEISPRAWTAGYWHPFTWDLLTVSGTRNKDGSLTSMNQETLNYLFMIAYQDSTHTHTPHQKVKHGSDHLGRVQ